GSAPRPQDEGDLARLVRTRAQRELEAPAVLTQQRPLAGSEPGRLEALDPAVRLEGERVRGAPVYPKHVAEGIRRHGRLGLALQEAHPGRLAVEDARLLLRVLHEVEVELVRLRAAAGGG